MFFQSMVLALPRCKMHLPYFISLIVSMSTILQWYRFGSISLILVKCLIIWFNVPTSIANINCVEHYAHNDFKENHFLIMYERWNNDRQEDVGAIWRCCTNREGATTKLVGATVY